MFQVLMNLLRNMMMKRKEVKDDDQSALAGLLSCGPGRALSVKKEQELSSLPSHEITSSRLAVF